MTIKKASKSSPPGSTGDAGSKQDVRTAPAQDDSPRATVTIVLSNYNQRHYLPQSLDGICGQTRPADRIIVVDDGSTDGSDEEIEQWLDRYPTMTLIRNKQNIGLQASIRRVMPLVDTDYFVWAASDDVLLPQFLEKSMAVLAKHPEAGLAFSELTTLRSDTVERDYFAKEPTVAHIYNLDDLEEYLPPKAVEARMKRSYFPPSSNTVVVRVDALKACGTFHGPLQWHSDWFAYNVVAARYGACVIPETLALLRVRAESYSASGMNDPNRQGPVVAHMLDLLASPDYADVRGVFRRAPSYYSVWGMLALKQMLRRPKMWPTAVTYAWWKVKEFKRGSQISWLQVAWRIGRRIVSSLAHRSGLARISFLIGSLNRRAIRAEAEIDVLANDISNRNTENDRLIARVQEVEAERDSARLEVADLAKEIDRLKESVRGVEKQRAPSLKAFERQAAEIDDLNERIRELEDERAAAVDQIEHQSTEIEALTDHVRELEGERDPALEEIERQSGDIERLTQRLGELEGMVGASEKALQAQEQDFASLKDEVVLAKAETATAQHEQVLTREALDESRKLIEQQLGPEYLRYDGDESPPELLPSVLINTMPRSGTHYLGQLFGRGLGFRLMIIGNQCFPHDSVYQPRLRHFMEGGYVSQDHFEASAFNIEMLRRHGAKAVIHLRDPRQAMLSYVHYAVSDWFRSNEREAKLLIYPALPDGFFDAPLSERIDWGIDEWLPLLIEWTRQWVKAQRDGLDVKFTRWEDMVMDQEAFAKDVMQFFGIAPERFNLQDITLDASVHYRKGEADEWRRAFSEAQIERANAKIPKYLATKFDWSLRAEDHDEGAARQAAGGATL